MRCDDLKTILDNIIVGECRIVAEIPEVTCKKHYTEEIFINSKIYCDSCELAIVLPEPYVEEDDEEDYFYMCSEDFFKVYDGDNDGIILKGTENGINYTIHLKDIGKTKTFEIDPDISMKRTFVTEEEREELLDNIFKHGIIGEPILVWNNRIIEGSERYKIFIEKGYGFCIEELYFKDEEQALMYKVNMELCSRKITEAQRRHLEKIRKKLWEGTYWEDDEDANE